MCVFVCRASLWRGPRASRRQTVKEKMWWVCWGRPSRGERWLYELLHHLVKHLSALWSCIILCVASLGIWSGCCGRSERHSGNHDDVCLRRAHLWDWTNCWLVNLMYLLVNIQFSVPSVVLLTLLYDYRHWQQRVLHGGDEEYWDDWWRGGPDVCQHGVGGFRRQRMSWWH